MKIQLENKNNNITRLEEEINELKESIKKKDEKNDSFAFNSSMNRSRNNSFQKSLSRNNESFEKESNRGGSITSEKVNFFGDLLGIPKITKKSSTEKKIE
jgi:primosomal protein N''